MNIKLTILIVFKTIFLPCPLLNQRLMFYISSRYCIMKMIFYWVVINFLYVKVLYTLFVVLEDSQHIPKNDIYLICSCRNSQLWLHHELVQLTSLEFWTPQNSHYWLKIHINTENLYAGNTMKEQVNWYSSLLIEQ